MMTKKTTTMKQMNKLLLQQLKGTGHDNQNLTLCDFLSAICQAYLKFLLFFSLH